MVGIDILLGMKDLFKITLASPDDVLGIQEVFYKTWLHTYPNKHIGVTVDDIEDRYKDAFSEETIRQRRESLANPKKERTLLVAKEGSIIIGICRIVRRSDKNQLHAIYVLPEFQGKGIGRLFWEEAKKVFDKNKGVVVEVATYNTKAIEFYKKLGFIDTGRRFQDEKFKMKSGAVITEMEMELPLG